MGITIRGKSLNLTNIKRYVSMMSSETRQISGFWMNFAGRSESKKKFLSLETPEQHYHFAKETFGLMQNVPEILGLVEYISERNPRFVCEIGTFEGGTNFLLSQGIPTVKQMIGVDLFVQHTTQLRYYCKNDRKVNFLNGSSYAAETVQKVEAILNGEKLDFLFIDGDHRYEGVKSDFLAYKHLVKEGGIIAFHDIAPDHKTRYGKDTGMWAGDVPVFWERLKQAYTHKEFVQNPDQDGLGIGALEYYKDRPLPDNL